MTVKSLIVSLCLLASPAIAQTPPQINDLARTLLADAPRSVEFTAVEILSQVSPRDGIYETRIDFTFGGRPDTFRDVDSVYGTKILRPLSQEDPFTLGMEVTSQLEGDEWKHINWNNLDQEGSRAYLTDIGFASDFAADSKILGSSEYDGFIAEVEQREAQYFSDLPQHLSGDSSCDSRDWEVGLGWEPDRQQLGAIKTTLTLTDPITGDSDEVSGSGSVDETGMISLNHRVDFNTILRSTSPTSEWPTIAELSKTANG